MTRFKFCKEKCGYGLSMKDNCWLNSGIRNGRPICCGTCRYGVTFRPDESLMCFQSCENKSKWILGG